MNGQVAGNLTYEKWLKRRSKKERQEILGITKSELFDRGELKLVDLINHQTGKPKTVAELV